MFKKIVGLGFSSKGKNRKSVKEYINSLVDSGAGEFFTGYNPDYWYTKYGFEVSPNGRFAEHEQITDRETLEAVVETVHEHGLELFVNLNAWYYTDETFPLIEKMMGEFQELGVDGIICGNISILEYLQKIQYKGKINISTIMALYNTESIHFFLENYPINKIILSREITLREIEILVNNFPDTSFEVFGEGDFCRYNNGLCYAEHKYGAKDICTIVVNDLVFKKKFRADFKDLILDETKGNEEKVELLSDQYQDAFLEIERLSSPLVDILEESKETNAKLLKLVLTLSRRVDIYFDAMQAVTTEHNRNILTLLKATKGLYEQKESFEKTDADALEKFYKELDISVRSGMEYLMSSTKKHGGLPKLRAQELAKFYAKGDSLNLYSYLFFSQFPNIDTVKFPTRGRNYSEKIALIERVLQEKKVPDELINRDISIERTHYDLSYLFGEKLWFRKLLQELACKK